AVNVLLPAACDNQAQLQIRIMTTNAINNDELIGIDDIEVSQDAAASVNDIIRDPNYVRISGNPSSVINIQFNKTISSEVQTLLFDAGGKLVLQKRLGRITEGQVEQISLGHLPKGLYMLSIKSKDGTFTTRVVN
ncbi:MAG: T9SS type A sorting domain-containing protein, partial [Chitinophagaceae bacterium]|nr:T9SS type A sorting domain-containing protein [Chitinophagaceae bacterium]